MSYYFSKTLDSSWEESIIKVTEALKTEGFGVVTDFDVSNAFKNKLGIDYKPYRILGVCNPPFAKRVLDIDDRIGTMLPCSLILQKRDNTVEVSVLDPVSAMGIVSNSEISQIALEIQSKLKNVIDVL